MTHGQVIPPPKSWADRRWNDIDQFRGTPGTAPEMWWWNGDFGRLEVDRAILGEAGEIIGKGGCGAAACTHVMLVQEGDLPMKPDFFA